MPTRSRDSGGSNSGSGTRAAQNISSNDPLTGGGDAGSLLYGNPEQDSASLLTSGDPLSPSDAPKGTGTTDIDNNGGLQELTGNAKKWGYTPAMMNQVYENPWAILADLFPNMSTSSPLYQALRDLGADPLTLFTVLAGSQAMFPETGGGSNFVDWLSNLFTQYGTPGGMTVNGAQALQNIFGQTKFGADAENSLGMSLGAGDQSTQTRTLFNLVRDIANMTMDPISGSAYQSAMQQAGDKYMNSQLKAGADTTMNPSAWIAQNYGNLVPR
jgi:hypothetical protein